MADTQSAAKYQVPSDSEALIKWAETKRKAGKSLLPERQMKLNLAYFLGEQWLVWDANKRQYSRPRMRTDNPNAPVRVTANKIAAIVETYIARLLKANPEPECRPVGDTAKDIDDAKVSTRILVSELHRLQWDPTQVDLYFWVVPLGWSYLQVTWDAGSGDTVGNDPDDNTPLFEGNIDFDIAPAFEMSVDPGGRYRDLSDSRWINRTVSMTPEAVWERWGVVLPSDSENIRTLAEEVYDLADRADDHGGRHRESVAVHQFWLRPGSRAKPEGMVFTYSGNTILEEPRPFPYKHGKLPYVQFDLFPGMGTRWGRTWVKDLIPLQADYNDARSREATIRRTLVPKIIAPTGSIDPKRVTTRVEIITYNPVGQPPKFEIPNGSWQQQFENSMSRAEQEMSDRAGQNDLSHVLHSHMPAAAIMAIQEADDVKLAIPARLNSQAIEQLGEMMLALVRQYWHEPRVVRTWSQDGFLEVQHFLGSDVNSQLDIHVESESSLPRSKAARAQLAMELRAEGLLPDPRAYVRMLDIPGVDLIVADMDADAKRQKRELNAMLQNQTAQVQTWDNHAIHLQTLNDFRKSEDYDALDEVIKGNIDGHAIVHEQMLLQQQMQMQQSGMVPPGGNGESIAGHNAPAGGPKPPPGPAAPPGGGAPGPKAQAGPPGSPPRSAASPPDQGLARAAGIGGPGEPGRVPGQSIDQEAARIGR